VCRPSHGLGAEPRAGRVTGVRALLFLDKEPPVFIIWPPQVAADDPTDAGAAVYFAGDGDNGQGEGEVVQ
jgi:hypothetical protein